MALNKPLTPQEKMEIVEYLKVGNLSHREIAKRFKRSQSTVSQIARDAGIRPSHRRRRTPAAKEDVEGTYSREERVAFADKFIDTLDRMIGSGGLTPREVREVAQAAKVALDARRSEDIEPATTNEPDEEGYVALGLGEMRVDPNTYIGRQMLKVEEELKAESGHPGKECGSSSFSAGDK